MNEDELEYCQQCDFAMDTELDVCECCGDKFCEYCGVQGSHMCNRCLEEEEDNEEDGE